MEISNRKRFRISVLFYLFLATVSVSAFAQEAKSQAILELDPDRYTDIILGVEETPPGTMMIRLKREGARAPREIKAPKINSSQFLRPVELTVEQQKTMAFQMYIKSILGSIDQLGRNNAVRLLAYRYQIDSKEASSILDFFGDVDKESDRIVMEQKRQNCESFEAAMSSLSSGLAADRMALAESQTGAASADYYEGIIDRLDSSLSSGASEKILEGVESMRGNLKTFNRDTPAYFAANSIDPASYYQSRCELLKQK